MPVLPENREKVGKGPEEEVLLLVPVLVEVPVAELLVDDPAVGVPAVSITGELPAPRAGPIASW